MVMHVNPSPMRRQSTLTCSTDLPTHSHGVFHWNWYGFANQENPNIPGASNPNLASTKSDLRTGMDRNPPFWLSMQVAGSFRRQTSFISMNVFQTNQIC